MKNTRTFSGRDLPFVGFSFMRWTESLDSTIHEVKEGEEGAPTEAE